MRTDEIKRALWNMSVEEFDERYDRKYGKKDVQFYSEWASAVFTRDVMWMFIKFMLDLNMDPESAYTLLAKDRKTLDALFEDACKAAEFC